MPDVRSLLFACALLPCASGCITIRVLAAPDRKFDPANNGVDAVIATAYLVVGVGGGAAIGHNVEAANAAEARDNAVRGGLIGLSVGVPLLGMLDWAFASELAPGVLYDPFASARASPGLDGDLPRPRGWLPP